MPYIHELPDWSRFDWDLEALAEPLASVRHRQGQLLGQLKYMGFKLQTEASIQILTSDVVKSSAIEGEELDPEEVRSSVARKLGVEEAGAPTSRNVDGVVEMLLDATRAHELPLTEKRLFGWHAALFPTGHTGMRRITVGAWRPEDAGPMQVVSGAIGRERVHYEAPPAGKVADEMVRFLEWFEKPTDIDPVLKAAVAHFWFVTIHPFEDGNGRIARAIADMALARSDGIPTRFYSMSSQIEAERNDYYDILEQTQKGGLSITPWMCWFLDCLYRALQRAEDDLGTVLEKGRYWQVIARAPINDRQRKVINRLLDGFEGHMNNRKYKAIGKCSPDTALRDIKSMVELGILIENPGGGRSTSYRLATIDEIERV